MPVTNYIYDPVTEAYLMEQDGDGNTTVVYTQEPVEYGDVIAQHRIDPVTGVGQSYYYHTDALGSTRELTDSNGDVVATYNYDAFGNTIASTGTVENPFRFTGNVGYYWDEELQAYHIRARNYEPTTGRWTSQDPIGFAGGNNLYGAYFVPNDTDPSGTDLFDIHDCGPVTKPKGIPSGSHCTWLTWLGTGNSVCCTANQIDAGEACCKKRGKRLSTCTHYPLNCGSKLLENVDLFVCRDTTREECQDDCEREKEIACDPQCRKIPEKYPSKRRMCWQNCQDEYSRCLHRCP